jgi:superfamily I DNA/RNA helicase/mRNA-degrading endonuclease RelE of RelBE toxin-antitoxin system
MEFRIADTFTDSLAKLPGQDQKAVKTTAFDLQMNPAHPALQFHRIERAKDSSFWSVRVNRDIRLIVHRTEQSMLLCYVDHHDRAYAWAERRRIERHPRTGAAQLVEIRERVEEVPVYAELAQAAEAKPPLFAHQADEVLLSYGVPLDWLGAVREVDEDGLFALAEHLPQEAAEALLDLAVGASPKVAEVLPAHQDAFAHPDAQRRFRVMANEDELRQALEYPWERWTTFLHPAQRELVERRFGGSARVAGSAGTGKTVVALHRATHLARRDPAARVLVTTFSRRLALALEIKLKRLLDQDPAALARVTVAHVDGIGYRLYELFFRARPNVASAAQIESVLVGVARDLGEERFSRRFLLAEWQTVVDAWQLRSWEAYRDISRLGRRTRVGGKQREALWAVFERTRAHLRDRNVMTWADILGRVTDHVAARENKPFTHVVADEAQDLSVPQLRMLAALVASDPDRLFFAGDLGQRIFQHPFSWRSLGIDVRGRSFSLKVNYRTSHQIRRRVDVLLPRQIRDVDGYEDSRAGTISVFEGPEPIIRTFEDEAGEIAFVGEWLRSVIDGGARPEEIGIFVRADEQLGRARRAVKAAGQEFLMLTDKPQQEEGRIAIGTMHLAKGLEFKAVAVMACDDDVMPLESRIEQASDESELDEVYETERHLLYVACTRARDQVLITGVGPGSEFLEDLRSAAGGPSAAAPIIS